MSDVIYLNDKNEIVPKDKATHYEMYQYDISGNVVIRIYGDIGKSSSSSSLSQVSGSVKVSEK